MTRRPIAATSIGDKPTVPAPPPVPEEPNPIPPSWPNA